MKSDNNRIRHRHPWPDRQHRQFMPRTSLGRRAEVGEGLQRPVTFLVDVKSTVVGQRLGPAPRFVMGPTQVPSPLGFEMLVE